MIPQEQRDIVDLNLPKGRIRYPYRGPAQIDRSPIFSDMAISVKMFATNVDATIISKALLPVGMQVPYTYALFSEFDRKSGYKLAQTKLPVQGTSEYVGVFVFGLNDPFYLFNVFGDIQTRLQIGDIYFLYTDSISAPSFFVFIIVNNPYTSIAGITANTAYRDPYGNPPLLVKWFKLITSTPIQYTAPLFLMLVDSIGLNRNDSINPLASRSVDDKQDDFIKVDKPFELNQYAGIASFIRFEADEILYQFKLAR